ncbi:ribosome maturation factor RimP [uncultured Imperialibacter sp.]|uniref:ribosome maturation factor RimP n=1 Tax=uncultured Imperialibacter sp. TaxID=1672639 RepID=UPI0030DCA13E|tara:strand:+ start:33047 stop:33496 length:450 start_codon:yes stop_codon:yes gene_type:complete
MAEESIIKDWLDEMIDSSLFVVEISLTGPKSYQKLRVFLDGDSGITIEQCAKISRKLAAKLDEEDLIKDAYQLEVSSAGIDQPLKLLRQYYKNIGRSVKVFKTDGKEEKGKLIAVSEQEIQIEVKNKKVTEMSTILFQDIHHTKVLVTF